MIAGGRLISSVAALRADLERTVTRIRLLTDLESCLIGYADALDSAEAEHYRAVCLESADAAAAAGMVGSQTRFIANLRDDLSNRSRSGRIQPAPLSARDLGAAAARTRTAAGSLRDRAHVISVALGQRWTQLGALVMSACVLAIALSLLLLRYRRVVIMQRAAEKQLAARQRQYKRVVETSNDLIWSVDCQGRWSFVNRSAAVRMLARTADELIGQPFCEDHGAGADADRRMLDRVLSGETVTGHESARYRADGARITLRFNAAPIHDDDGRIIGASGTASDLTDRKLAEQALRQSEARLQVLHTIATLAGQSVPPTDLIGKTIDCLHRQFPDYRSAYCTIDDCECIRVVASRQPPSMPDITGASADLRSAPEYLATLRRDEALIVNDVTRTPRVAPLLTHLDAAATRAMLDVPLRHSDKLMGLLCLDSDTPRAWAPDEVETLVDVAQAVAIALHNARIEQARQETEASLRESELRFRQLAETIDQVFWLWDYHTGEIVYVSPAYQAIWARPLESIYRAPQSWLDAVHPEDRTRVRQAFMHETMADRYDIEYRIIRPDGQLRWIHDRAFPVYDGDKRRWRIAGVSTDISARKLAEQRLRQHEEELSHLGRLSVLGEMATTLAHELNQPMCAISSYSQACMRLVGAQSATKDELLETMRKVAGQAQRAGRIIRSIKDFARKQPPQMAPADLVAIIEDAIELVQGNAHRQGIEISFDRPHNPVHVIVARLPIEQVVLNLVANAMDALVELTTPDRRVDIMIRDAGSRGVEVCVRDNGCGLAPEAVDRALEPFFTTKPAGVGLGLAISQSIVESHGGRLTLEAAPSGGVEARFCVPHAQGVVHGIDEHRIHRG